MTMTRWEYASVSFDTRSFFGSPSLNGDAFGQKLDEYGRAGWELVSVFDMNRYKGDTSEVVAVFKRPLSASASS